jgi:hypothetical protein
VFKAWKGGNKASRDQDRRNSSPKEKLQKPDHPVWDTKLSIFSRTDSVTPNKRLIKLD